jgi:hypothetical protein
LFSKLIRAALLRLDTVQLSKLVHFVFHDLVVRMMRQYFQIGSTWKERYSVSKLIRKLPDIRFLVDQFHFSHIHSSLNEHARYRVEFWYE